MKAVSANASEIFNRSPAGLPKPRPTGACPFSKVAEDIFSADGVFLDVPCVSLSVYFGGAYDIPSAAFHTLQLILWVINTIIAIIVLCTRVH